MSKSSGVRKWFVCSLERMNLRFYWIKLYLNVFVHFILLQFLLEIFIKDDNISNTTFKFLIINKIIHVSDVTSEYLMLKTLFKNLNFITKNISLNK